MALAIDPSTPATLAGVGNSAVTTMASNAFSPPAGSLVQVYASDGNNAISVTGMTGGGLTFSRKAQSIQTGKASMECWEAVVGATPPGSMTVTVTWASASENQARMISPIVWADAASDQSTAHTATQQANAVPSATLAAAAADSWIIGAVHNWDGGNPTVPAGQTTTLNGISQLVTTASGDSHWVQANTAAGNSNLKINDTAPSCNHAMVVVEVLAAAASGQTVTVGQATETETAQPVGRAKVKALGQPVETETAQPISKGQKIIALGQAVESSLAQALGRLKARVIGEAGVILGPPPLFTEQPTEFAQPIAVAKTRAVGQAVESDLAQPVTKAGARVVILGQATETSLAQALARLKAKGIGQAAEPSTAQPLARRKSKATGQAVETQLAQLIGRVKVKATGQATETELAQPITLPGHLVIVLGQAVETDTAQAITRTGHRIIAVGQAFETSLAQLFGVVRSHVIGQAVETSTAQPLSWSKVKGVNQAVELDTARPIIVPPKAVPARLVLAASAEVTLSLIARAEVTLRLTP